jgi:hypothetical protein
MMSMPLGCRMRHVGGVWATIARILMLSLLLFGWVAALATLRAHLRAQWHDGAYRVSSRAQTMAEGDYSLLWTAGQLAAAGHPTDIYDGIKLLQWREQTLGAGWSRLDWLYPPPMIALGLAAARLPLLPGYIAWLVLSCGLSCLALRAAGLSWRIVLFGLFGPPTWTSLALGQFAPLAASLVFAGLLQAHRAPLRAGLGVAAATLKPHLGLLVPVVWIAQRRWAAFGAAAGGTLILAAVSTVLFGMAIWPAFLHGAGASGRTLLETGFGGGFPVWGASVFWMIRSFGGTIDLAYAAQALAAVLAVLVAWVAARRGPDLRTAVVAACVMSLVSPYFYVFDLVGYSIAVAVLAERRGFGTIPMLLWLLPGVSEALTVVTGRQALPILVVIVAGIAWRVLAIPAASHSADDMAVAAMSDDGVAAAEAARL